MNSVLVNESTQVTHGRIKMGKWFIFVFSQITYEQANLTNLKKSKAFKREKILRNYLETGKLIKITLNSLFHLVLWVIRASPL